MPSQINRLRPLRKAQFMVAAFLLNLGMAVSVIQAQDFGLAPRNAEEIFHRDSYASTGNLASFDQAFTGPKSETNGQWTSLFAIDGSKQPQDFGVNANVGGLGQISWSAPVNRDRGIGFQLGTTAAFSANAVQVYELLGESTDRFQSFTTAGLFQRLPNGIAIGAAFDFLYQESFDQFSIGQWRAKAAWDNGLGSEFGMIMNVSAFQDQGQFNQTAVTLSPIDQLRWYVRNQWESGVTTTLWMGVAKRHGEENAVTGSLPAKEYPLLAGADLHVPLNARMAIYGEANLMMPSDTGAVDAFLGIEIASFSAFQKRDRGNRYRPFFSVAASPSFTVDLERR